MSQTLACPQCGGFKFYQSAIPDSAQEIDERGYVSTFALECGACGCEFDLYQPPSERADLIDLGPASEQEES